MPGVKVLLTFHTSRNTKANSGMNSKERRLRSTTTVRALGSWSGEKKRKLFLSVGVTEKPLANKETSANI